MIVQGKNESVDEVMGEKNPKDSWVTASAVASG